MQAGDGKHYDPVLPTADATPVYKSVNGKDFHLNIFNRKVISRAILLPVSSFFGEVL